MRASLLSCFLACQAMAADPWTKADVAWETAYLVTLAADWSQTRQFPKQYGKQEFVSEWVSVRNQDNSITSTYGYWRKHYVAESNPILGREPSRTKIDIYFALAAWSHYWVAKRLPMPWRRWWQVYGGLIQLGYVHRNYRLRFSIKF